MIKCPKCTATLPDGSGYCQFCQSTFVPVGPVQKQKEKVEIDFSGMPKWVWPAYRGIAIWWIVTGLYGIASTLLGPGKDTPDVLFMAAEGLSAMIGIGLLAKVEFVRKLVNICCFLTILQGGLGVVRIIISPHITGILALIQLLIEVLNIGCAVLMIYLIGETESQMAT